MRVWVLEEMRGLVLGRCNVNGFSFSENIQREHDNLFMGR